MARKIYNLEDVLMRLLCNFCCSFIISCLFASQASAGIISVFDRDLIEISSDDQYQVNAALTLFDPFFSVGFKADPGDFLSVTVTAPDEFNLYASITTDFDFFGSRIAGPAGIPPVVFAGTSYVFEIFNEGFFGQNDFQFLSIGIDSSDFPTFSSVYGGELAVGSLTSSDGFYTGDNGGGDMNSVPVPGTLALFGLGLFGLAWFRLRSRLQPVRLAV